LDTWSSIDRATLDFPYGTEPASTSFACLATFSPVKP
jgi:hypothetical protein